MGLFDRFKKGECGICGKEIGAMGKRKVDDGYICKDCNNKISRFYSNRKRSTTEDVARHLDYREANKEEIEKFQVSRTFGITEKVLIDDNAGTFVIVSNGKNWRDSNPDVISLSDVTGAQVDFDESRSEETYLDDDGNTRSYNPPKYTYSYDVDVNITLNNEWFDEIRVSVDNGSSGSSRSYEAEQARNAAQEICTVLTAERERIHEKTEAAKQPKIAQTCPFCNASTIPDENGRCEYCGGAIGTQQ